MDKEFNRMDDEKKKNLREMNSKNDNNKSLAMTTPSSQSLPLLMTDLCALEPGMDVISRTPAHGPYHTHHQLNNLVHNFHHHTDQTKSLQELQNEVGALLEFRDLVIETFPDLKHKMASSGASSTITGLQSSSIVSRREWEPGIRVRRKLNSNFSSSKDGSNSGEIIQSSSLTRSRSNSHSGKKEPKSGEGNGSVIQDSGFSTETSSSKEAHSASSSAGSAIAQSNSGALTARLTSDPTCSSSDNELWNLLDVIHMRTSRGTDVSDQKFANGKSSSSAATAFQSQMNFMPKEEVQQMRKERDHMMDKLGDFEAELLASRIKESKLQDQILELQQTKADLEHQLKYALSQKHDFNKFLSNTKDDDRNTRPNSNRTFQPIKPSEDGVAALVPQKALKDELNKLGRLDGLISNPRSKLNKVRVLDSKKIAAILLETNIIELQRHLLTITVQNQVLQQRLDQATKSKIYLTRKFDKSKEDVEDLRFQIEERNIELEGTRAQLRVMESKLASRFDGGSSDHQLSSTARLSRDGITVMHTSTPNSRLMQQTISTPSMKAMIPLPMDETFQLSSSTESAQDQQERDAKCVETPRRAKPSKIPLPGMSKSAISPISSAKPPSGRGSANTTGPPSNRSLTKSTSSLYNGARLSGPPSITRGMRDLSLSRPDSLRNTSIDGKILRSSSIPISSKPITNFNGSSPSAATAFTTGVNIPASSPLNSKYVTSSPLPRPKRDSLTTRVKNLDSLSRLQSSSTGTLSTTTSPSSGTIMRLPNSQNSNNNHLVTNGSNNNRKYTALPVRRMSNTVRDDHHHSNNNHYHNSSNVSGGESVNSSGKVHSNSNVIKKSWTESNISSAVENENPILFRSRELIREYMGKTRVPEILKTSSNFQQSAMSSEINLAYKHPLVILEELQHDAGEALATDSVSLQNQSRSIIVPQKNSLGYNRKLSGDRPHLIGKVTPNIARTWEQLSSAMNEVSNNDDEDDEEKMSGMEEDKQSYVLFVRKPFNFNGDDDGAFDVHQAGSEKFYDSIEYGDDYDYEEEQEEFDGRETMAEGVDSLEMRENNAILWSIES